MLRDSLIHHIPVEIPASSLSQSSLLSTARLYIARRRVKSRSTRTETFVLAPPKEGVTVINYIISNIYIGTSSDNPRYRSLSRLPTTHPVKKPVTFSNLPCRCLQPGGWAWKQIERVDPCQRTADRWWCWIDSIHSVPAGGTESFHFKNK